jgi:hypothetical protein
VLRLCIVQSIEYCLQHGFCTYVQIVLFSLSANGPARCQNLSSAFIQAAKDKVLGLTFLGEGGGGAELGGTTI